MIKFDEEYFRDEVRDGFYVPSICKRAWASELELLAWLHETCKKHGIKYCLDWGSTIGAIRHGGFIPWDDDVDVAMHRNEYRKLREIANDELPEGWAFLDFHNSDNWRFIVCLTNTPRMNFAPEYLETHYNFPYIATVDIFILDNVTDDEEYENKRCDYANKLFGISDLIDCSANRQKISRALNDLRKSTGISIREESDLIKIKRRVFGELEKIFSAQNDVPTERIGQFVPWVLEQGLTYERKYYEDVIEVPFENLSICIPMAYESMLSRKYGNYLRISYSGVAHNYPYFNSQRLALGNDVDYIPHYKISPGVLCNVRKRMENNSCVKSFAYLSKAPDRGYREIVFIPYEYQYWYSCGWDDIYRRIIVEAEKVDYPVRIYVIPTPVYTKDALGQAIEYRFDYSNYPEDVCLTSFEEYDFAVQRPDEIYIQSPYDEFNMAEMIHPDLFASRLIEYTNRLVYVPYFSVNDFEMNSFPQRYNMQYYVEMPGVVLADAVYLESEKMVENYIECLTEFAGEDSRDIWQQKIMPISTFLGQYEEKTCAAGDGRRKKLMYYISPSPFYSDPDKYMAKIRFCMKEIKENKGKVDISLAFDPLLNDEIWNAIERPDIACEFSDLIKDYPIIEINGDNTREHETLEKKFDAYYGLPSVYAKNFIMCHKPVMVQSLADELG